MTHVFQGFGISVERILISELKGTTYYARMVLQQRNELGRKIVEVDARPSDCLAMATAQKKPIFVSAPLFEEVEDMSHILEDIKNSSSPSDELCTPARQVHPVILSSFVVKMAMPPDSGPSRCASGGQALPDMSRKSWMAPLPR